MYHILIADDDRTVCKSLELLLRKSGYGASSIHLIAELLDAIERVQPSIVILDMNYSINTSGRQGMRALEIIQEHHPGLPVILITGWATLQLAVEGMKKGAKDFIAKPWDNKHLISSIETTIALYLKEEKNAKGDIGETDEFVIGKSASYKEVLSIVDRVAQTDASVLITGESGTGKEVIAELIHNKSKRKDHPFVKVNLGGISTSLFESEMFGHKKGAFTDASADRDGRFSKAEGGTIFLDEIGDLALESQVKLLRVLQEKTYEVLGSSKTIKTDIRVISATHKPLREMVSSETFREDLFYRINLIDINIPSLKERKEDIPLLVKHFIKNVCHHYEFDLPIIEDQAYVWLSNQSYPGNIRQLRNIVERTALLSINKKVLDIKDFQKNMVVQKRLGSSIELPEIGEVTLEELEKQMIKKALAYHNHSISKTSRSLGLTRSSLYRRMEKYGL